MIIISIDCGASFIKASKFVDNIIVETIIEKTPSDNNPNKLEQSVEVIKDIICRLSLGEKEVHIGFSNEMHGFVLADESGRPVLPYMSWQNERAYNSFCDTTFLEEFRNSIDDKHFVNSGMPLKVGLPSVNLFCVLNAELKDYKGELYFYTLGDYYIRALSGSQPYMHITNAAGTGLYDLLNDCWNYEVINQITINTSCRIVFPEIYINQKAIKISGDADYYYYPALGDQQAALLGAGVSSHRDLSLNFGTGAQISILSDSLEFSNKYQVRPYFNNLYLKTVPHIPSGRALNVYFNFVKNIICRFKEVSEEQIWKYINAEAEINDKQLMQIDMSFFTNSVTNNINGSISGICENGLTIGNLFESVYAQMAENIKEICVRLQVDNVNQIVISGGILRKNKLLREKVLSKFAGNIKIILAENETAQGICKFINTIM